MVMLHDENGHQGLGMYNSSRIKKDFIGALCCIAIQSWVKNCKHCKTAKGPYMDPEPPEGSVVANNPMNLMLVDFMKLDPSKSGKDNVLVMTDTFSKFNVAVMTPNQKAKMVAKALIDKWFYTYQIPPYVHSDQGKIFDNQVIEQWCKLYSIQWSTTTPYNPQGNSPLNA